MIKVDKAENDWMRLIDAEENNMIKVDEAESDKAENDWMKLIDAEDCRRTD